MTFRSLLLGFILILIVVAGAMGAVLATGRWNVAASRERQLIDRVADRVKMRSVSRHAASLTLPAAAPDAVRTGMDHFATNCLPCHGTRGVAAWEFHEGMNPEPPRIDVRRVQRFTDAELFWIIKNGIAMTGMPAFGASHNDNEIRSLVAFVRHTPELTDAERQELRQHLPPGHHSKEGEVAGAGAHEHGAASGASPAPASPAPADH